MSKNSDWKKRFPKENGVYLTKLYMDDPDSEAETFHIIDGKGYTPEGVQYYFHRGVWKYVGPLPK